MKAEIIPSLCAGTDLDIANAARRSFDASHEILQDSDTRLIEFLAREGHWLPFRHPQLSFSCEAPLFVARQLGKHQVGMSWSEVSRRYKTEDIEFYYPTLYRAAPASAKQGTGPVIPDADTQQLLRNEFAYAVDDALYIYTRMIDAGVAPEMARMILPQSMYVKWTWTGSLLAWLHLIKERTHPNAQTETREWVEQWIVPAVRERFPVAYTAVRPVRSVPAYVQE